MTDIHQMQALFRNLAVRRSPILFHGKINFITPLSRRLNSQIAVKPANVQVSIKPVPLDEQKIQPMETFSFKALKESYLLNTLACRYINLGTGELLGYMGYYKKAIE